MTSAKLQTVTSHSRVTYEPSGENGDCAPGETLLDSARRLGARIAAPCGGRGVCKSCVIQIVDGAAPEPSEQDRKLFTDVEIKEGWRRACQVIPFEDCRVNVPARSQAAPSRTQVDGGDIWVRPDPVVRTYRIAVEEPSLESGLGDGDRLLGSLNDSWAGSANSLDIDVLRTVSATLRAEDWSVQAVTRYGEVIGLLPGKARLYGLAIDLGTTNVAVLLVNLRNGKTVATKGLENPQASFGGDLITRIAYAKKSAENLDELRNLVVSGINEAVCELCEAESIDSNAIADVVIAGNTAMQHLLLAMPVNHLGTVPFAPGINDVVDVKARDVGINTMPGAYVHVMSNVAGFVGGDHTAALLALNVEAEGRTVVVLDIGTNTEISLLHEGNVYSASCPSGPALEGGNISSGMRAAVGAIESISIYEDQVKLKTIGDSSPVGVCGSGVIDAVAEMYRIGILNRQGRICEGHPNVHERDGKREFMLAGKELSDSRDVVLTQQDVRSLQLATAAIRSGIDLLLETCGLDELALDEVVIAGAFGNYISLESSITIGMLPSLSVKKFSQVGNAAGIGAKLALVSHVHRASARALSQKAEYLELAGYESFMKVFMERLNFPKKS